MWGEQQRGTHCYKRDKVILCHFIEKRDEQPGASPVEGHYDGEGTGAHDI